MNPRQYRVLVGPYRIARRYATSMGWSAENFVIVSRAHQLRQLDPATIASICTVRLGELSHRIRQEILAEVFALRALWPVPVAAA